ncbi:Uncharacterised protein [uncultured Blautia sp.]|nr:hypothetical protein [uncultured Blautia sp.]SCH68823.1 Uncharacterised protein [uncultured Blautia sp.]
MKKNTKNTFGRSFSILAAAALSMTLIGGQAFPTYAGSSSGIETGAMIPDNITIDTPTALANVALPSNEYGTLSWVDGSYVPQKRVQSCEVVFKPSAGADLSGLPGWDSASGTLTGYVTVVVSSLDSASEDTDNDEQKDSSQSDESYDTENSDKDSKDVSDKETQQDSKDENADQEDSSSDSSSADSSTDKNSDSSTDVKDPAEEDKNEEDPEVTEVPDITVTPVQKDDSQNTEEKEEETAETTVTPAASDTGDNTEDTDNNKKENNSEITEIPEITENPDENTDNIFDRKDEPEDKRPQNAATDITETEMEAIAQQNHTCDGITVSGIDLPWYVQFRVSGGDDYQFTNEEDAAIFKSYEFELWDTQKNTEYKIPDGEYISVTVPVKAGYTYSIEHLLDNGAMETIIPSVDGDTMTFSTHSFSPFGIAGSKSLVGPDAGSDSSVTVTPAADTSSSDTGASSSVDTSSDSSESTDEMDTSQDLSSGTAELTDSSSQNDTESSESEDQYSQAKSKKQVNTGDTTQILPFVILFVAAAVVAGVVVFLKKRKK